MKKCIFIIIILIIIMSFIPAYADMNASAYYPDMNQEFSVSLDGQYWFNESDYGSPIYPFFIEGGLYLPLDLMNYMMDVDAIMNYETNSLELSSTGFNQYIYYDEDPNYNPNYSEEYGEAFSNALSDHMVDMVKDSFLGYAWAPEYSDEVYTDEEFQKDLDEYMITFEADLKNEIEKATGRKIVTDADREKAFQDAQPAIEIASNEVLGVWERYKTPIVIVVLLYIAYKIYEVYSGVKKENARDKEIQEYQQTISKLTSDIEKLTIKNTDF